MRYDNDEKMKRFYLGEVLKNSRAFLSERAESVKYRVYGEVMLVAGAVAGTYCLLVPEQRTIAGVLMVLSAITAALSFTLSFNIQKRAIASYGEPYAQMDKEYLIVGQDGLQIGYECIKNNKSQHVLCEIPFSEIVSAEVDNDYATLTIVGPITTKVYSDAEHTELIPALSSARTFSDNRFSFIFACDGSDAAINTLQAVIGKRLTELG